MEDPPRRTPVTVRGRDLRSFGEVFEGKSAEEGLSVVLRAVPAYRRHGKVELDEGGRPTEPEALWRVAESNALVSIRNISETGRA